MLEETSPLAVIPDCNVLIHGKPLRELPWDEWGFDPLEILIVGPVLGELDAVKTRPGRPGRLARDASTEIRELLKLPDRTDVIRAAKPRVTRRLWLGGEAKEPMHPSIDLTHGDQTIINRGLWLLDQGRNVVFLTDDTLAAAHAAEFGLPYRLLPDTWVRPPEKDESQKRAERLEAEIVRLKSTEPKLRAWFADSNGEAIERIDATMKRYAPVPPALVRRLMMRISAANPLVERKPPPEDPKPRTGPVDLSAIGAEWARVMGPITARAQTKYEEEYAAWIAGVEAQLRDLHLTRRRRREWPTATLMGVNEGSRPATKALVEIVVGGDFSIARPVTLTGKTKQVDENRRAAELDIAMPPTPPSHFDPVGLLLGRQFDPLDLAEPRYFDPAAHLKRTRDADSFYWKKGRDEPSDRMELECENWRHQREPEDFVFSVMGNDAKAIAGIVTGSLSATNMTLSVEVRLTVRIAFEDQPLEPVAEQMVVEFERSSVLWRKAQRLKPASAQDR